MTSLTSKYKKGQKVERVFTNRFGQEIKEVLTVMAVDDKFIMLDDGSKFFTV